VIQQCPPAAHGLRLFYHRLKNGLRALVEGAGDEEELYDEDYDEETGKLKPDLVKEDAPGTATQGTESAKIGISGRSITKSAAASKTIATIQALSRISHTLPPQSGWLPNLLIHKREAAKRS
jgi:hypothetical protein